MSKPLLVGLIVDVSSSMKRNWKNRDGKKLPRIQVVRDVLNNQIKRHKLVNKNNEDNSRKIEIFCIGMGFKKLVRLKGVSVERGYEKIFPDQQLNDYTDAGVICDLIALSEMLPNEDAFQRLTESIDQKWSYYIDDLIQKTDINDDAEENLQNFIKNSIQINARRRGIWFPKSGLYRILKFKHRLNQVTWITSLVQQLERDIEERNRIISEKSQYESERFRRNVLIKAKEIIEGEKQSFADFIISTVQDFVHHQCVYISGVIALGYSPKTAVESFNDKALKELGITIYEHLSKKITEAISVAWQLNVFVLLSSIATVGAYVDRKKLRELTKKCIEKHSWEILKPLVVETIKGLFLETFETLTEDNLARWITLASAREVTRPLSELVDLLPNIAPKTIYSDMAMFGVTPLYQAVNQASLRFLDRRYENYDKTLIIISDGEFSTEDPTPIVELLKKAGVVVVTCCVKDKDIMPSIINKPKSKRPKGVGVMYDMASIVSGQNHIVKTLENRGFQLKQGTKLFYQINQSDLLEDVIEGILSYKA